MNKRLLKIVSTLAIMIALGMLLIPHLLPESATGSNLNTPVDPHKPTLIFFMNPQGAPCLLQKKILDGVLAEVSSVVNIHYAKVNDVVDQNLFYQHGIRGLPSLILVDTTGKEMHRFSAGIHEGKTIVDEIQTSLHH